MGDVDYRFGVVGVLGGRPQAILVPVLESELLLVLARNISVRALVLSYHVHTVRIIGG